MLYPENLFNKLSFDQVLREIRNLNKTASGRFLAEKIDFITDVENIRKLFLQIKEFEEAKQEDAPGIVELEDVSGIIRMLRTSGVQLNPDEIWSVRGYLVLAFSWKNFLTPRRTEFPELNKIFDFVQVDPELLRKIEMVIAPDGSIKDNASLELSKIRKAREKQSKSIRHTVHKIFNQLKQNGYVPEGSSVTIKNGRTVIPVFAEFKRRVSGYVQDESATGQTVYIEPSELIDAVNQLQELEAEERREIIRILKELSNELHLQVNEIYRVQPSVGILDLIAAKTDYMLKHGFVIPAIRDDQSLQLYNASHPLLLIANRKEGKKTVPLSLSINEEDRIIVISGPNAGGKSVSLKTVGLLQLMVQSGIPVPVEEGSEFGVFKDVFIDIGDDQSIENDLSTYSSHLLHVHTAVSKANNQSLLLFDEFGSGTEPQMGGAIAQAALERFVSAKCRGIITTHYTNIKELAENTAGIQNAAMGYDTEKLEPLFELRVGKPGQSFALEIAKKIGFEKDMIKRAEALTGQKLVELDRLISKTEQQKHELSVKEKEINRLQQQVTSRKQTYDERLAAIREKEKEIIKKATFQAEQLISSANKEIEKTIRHIKITKAHQEETKKVRSKLATVKGKISESTEKIRKSEANKHADGKQPLKAGDYVRLQG